MTVDYMEQGSCVRSCNDKGDCDEKTKVCICESQNYLQDCSANNTDIVEKYNSFLLTGYASV